MILETERLILRELTHDDFDALYAVLASYSTAVKNGMRFTEEYEDPDNAYTRAYRITREEWEKIHDQGNELR